VKGFPRPRRRFGQRRRHVPGGFLGAGPFRVGLPVLRGAGARGDRHPGTGLEQIPAKNRTALAQLPRSREDRRWPPTMSAAGIPEPEPLRPRPDQTRARLVRADAGRNHGVPGRFVQPRVFLVLSSGETSPMPAPARPPARVLSTGQLRTARRGRARDGHVSRSATRICWPRRRLSRRKNGATRAGARHATAAGGCRPVNWTTLFSPPHPRT